MRATTVRTIAVLAGLGLGLSACGTSPGDGRTPIDYWLWDANQLPAYQRCADAFERTNDDVHIRISQYGWDDYWQKVTAGFVAGAGPDVFTDHVGRYPDYVTRGVLLDLDSLEPTAAIDGTEFQEGLAELWVGPDGKRYGMPKDFDTIGLFYDQDVIAEAGLSPEDLAELDWNPQDGGTFEEVLARLSVDADGNRGDEEGFDPTRVVTYGLSSDGIGSGYVGQTQWAHYALSTGWTHTDAPVWGTRFNFDDEVFQETMDWYFGLVDKGFMPPFEEIGASPDVTQQLGSGRVGLAVQGSWMVSTFARIEGIDLGIAPLPAGPLGHPVSMYNGLGDSISAQSEYPQEAARWVAFLGSDECQEIVGEAAVVFPARPAGTEAAIAAYAEQGIDVTPFTDLVEKGHTGLYPLTENGASIEPLMSPAMERIYMRSRDAESLTAVNERVNALFD